VIQVDNGGLAMALRVGRATVTASAGAATRSMDVTVVNVSGASVSVTPRTANARTGDVLRFSVQVKDATGRTIDGIVPSWTMAPGRGEIGSDGSFVGYEPGSYLISASLGRLSADIPVTLTERNVRRKTAVVGSVLRSAFVTSEVWVHPNGKVAYLGTHAGGDRFYAIDITDPAKPAIADSVVENFRIVNDIMTDEKGEVLVFTREGADNRRRHCRDDSRGSPPAEESRRLHGRCDRRCSLGIHLHRSQARAACLHHERRHGGGARHQHRRSGAPA
jgi:hypothetical protein